MRNAAAKRARVYPVEVTSFELQPLSVYMSYAPISTTLTQYWEIRADFSNDITTAIYTLNIVLLFFVFKFNVTYLVLIVYNF